MFILLVAWIAAGLIAGFVASKVVKLGDDDPRIGFIIGALAAIVGGGVTHFLSKTPPNAVDYMSMLIATAASVVAVIIYFIIRKSASRA